MITFITLGLIICTSFFVYYGVHTKDKTDIKEWFLNFCISYIMMGIIYAIVAGIALTVITFSMADTWEFGWENKIVAMQDSTAYVVSRHNVESSDRYYYMVEYGSDHYKQHWVSQNRTDIFETDSNNYVIKTYNKVINPSNWIMKDLDKFRNVIVEDEQKWEFYVPKGSVVQDFTVDLK